jgi:hypothetical protein
LVTHGRDIGKQSEAPPSECATASCNQTNAAAINTQGPSLPAQPPHAPAKAVHWRPLWLHFQQGFRTLWANKIQTALSGVGNF